MKSAHCIVLIALVVKLGYGQILYDWGDGNGALYDWGDGNDHRREVNRQLVFSRPTVTGFDGFSNEALSSESLEVEPFSNGADYNRGSSSKERKKRKNKNKRKQRKKNKKRNKRKRNKKRPSQKSSESSKKSETSESSESSEKSESSDPIYTWSDMLRPYRRNLMLQKRLRKKKRTSRKKQSSESSQKSETSESSGNYCELQDGTRMTIGQHADMEPGTECKCIRDGRKKKGKLNCWNYGNRRGMEVEPFSTGADYNRGSSSKERKKGKNKKKRKQRRKNKKRNKRKRNKKRPSQKSSESSKKSETSESSESSEKSESSDPVYTWSDMLRPNRRNLMLQKRLRKKKRTSRKKQSSESSQKSETSESSGNYCELQDGTRMTIGQHADMEPGTECKCIRDGRKKKGKLECLNYGNRRGMEVEPFSTGADYNRGSSSKERKKEKNKKKRKQRKKNKKRRERSSKSSERSQKSCKKYKKKFQKLCLEKLKEGIDKFKETFEGCDYCKCSYKEGKAKMRCGHKKWSDKLSDKFENKRNLKKCLRKVDEANGNGAEWQYGHWKSCACGYSSSGNALLQCWHYSRDWKNPVIAFETEVQLTGEPTIRPPVLPYCQLSDGRRVELDGTFESDGQVCDCIPTGDGGGEAQCDMMSRGRRNEILEESQEMHSNQNNGEGLSHENDNISTSNNNNDIQEDDWELDLLDIEDLEQSKDIPAHLEDKIVLDNIVLEHLSNFKIPQDNRKDFNTKVSMEHNRMTLNQWRAEMFYNALPLNQPSSEGLSASWTNDGSSQTSTNDESSQSLTNDGMFPRRKIFMLKPNRKNSIVRNKIMKPNRNNRILKPLRRNLMRMPLWRTEMFYNTLPLNQHSSKVLSASWTNDGSSPSWTNDGSSPSWTNNRFSPSWTNNRFSPSWTNDGSSPKWSNDGS